MRAFRAMWAALKDAFDELMLLIICNLLWVLISGPLLLLTLLTLREGATLAAVPLALLAVLPMGPATAGLANVAHRISEGRASTWRDFFAGLRRYAVPSWKLLGTWVAVLMLIVIDLIFYSGLNNLFGLIMIILWFNLLILWVGALIYIFPLLLLQEEPSLRLLARNAFLMTMGRPLFTFVTLVLMLLITVLTSLLPILPLLITVALLAQWSFRATMELVKDAEERRAALAEAQARKQGLPPKRPQGEVWPPKKRL